MAGFLKDTCWVYSCCVCGLGCTSCTPLVQGQHKICCCRNRATTGEECCGPLGCCGGLTKLCCFVHHNAFGGPMKCALCNAFVCGGQPTASGMYGADEAMEIALMQSTFWCWYCPCIGGFGCAGSEPMVKSRSKLCCVMSEAETADCMGPEGCCTGTSKTCCLAHYQSCPPRMTPGIGLCNIMFMSRMGDERDVMVAVQQPPPQQAMR